ncbi:unnamed protein product [Heligmosomoides polygyrus]|uniref:Amidase domain-containing protein n=1 Tax=Heligmosomoides polygyrus TaxID=6339 RepID=A0A183GRB6_HELPZ|nr:unnamed protein product [Heligmosomoides polygyrus]
MFHTAALLSSSDDLKSASMEMASRNALSDGYVPDNMPKRDLPFITDALSTQVRDCVRKAELDDLVRVVEIPLANPKAKLNGVSMTAHVILIPAWSARTEYIDETDRPLCVKVKEHVDGLGLDKCKVSTPLGEHRLRSHSGAVVEIAVTILARDSDVAARKGVVVCVQESCD